MIINLLLLFLLGHNINEEVAIENLVGNWERVCLENDALGFEFSGDNRIIATVFDFEMEKSGKPYVRIGTGGRYLRFAFTQGSCKTDLRIRMDQEENYSFELEIDGEAQEISIIS